MLTKNAKSIYTLLRNESSGELSYYVLAEKLGLDYNTVKSACDLIVEQGLAETKCYKASIPASIVLTEKGKHRFVFGVNALADFLVRSIAIPVAVSLVSSIVTTLITMRWFG